MTMREASGAARAASAGDVLLPAPTALAERLLAVNGYVMGWHPVRGMLPREARA